MKEYVVHVLLPRQGGYKKWTQSVPLPKGEAETEQRRYRGLGYKTRLKVAKAAGRVKKETSG